MCSKTADMDPWSFRYIPDHFKTQEMCDEAVACNPYTLKYVPNWFVAEEPTWYDDNDELFKWYEGYEKRMTHKAKTEQELILVIGIGVFLKTKKKRQKNSESKHVFFLSNDQI